MGTKRPQNDELILDLLERGRIVVIEDSEDPVWHEGELKPRTKIFVRDMRNGKMQQQTMFPKHQNGHPYFSIYPWGREGGMVWLSARRVVWYAFNRRQTYLMVCPVDGNPWNYNRWNLCLRDQNEENYIRMLNKERPQAEEGGSGSWNEPSPGADF